jgi:hypothetical protein
MAASGPPIPIGKSSEQNAGVPEPGGFATLEAQMLHKFATVAEFFLVMVVGFGLVTYAWFDGPELARSVLDRLPGQSTFTKPPKGRRADDVIREALQTFDRTVRMAPKGASYFSLPESVSRYEEFKVAFIVGPKERQRLLERALKEANPQSIGAFAAKDIPLTRTMTATLTGDRFTIAPTSQATQAISAQSPTTWTWLVSAKEAGQFTLAYSVTGQLDSNTKDGPSRDLVKGEQLVEVRMDPLGFAKEKDNWQWLLSALLIPFGVFVYRRLTKQPAPDPKADWRD